MARLVIESGEDSGMIYPIGSHSVLLGRGQDCTFRIIDRRVSRHHARISRIDSDYVLDDLQSRNGTYLNHEPVTGRARLRNGDAIDLGGTRFIFEYDAHDAGAPQQTQARVRMAAGMQHQVHAERPMDTDTSSTGEVTPLPQGFTADPITRLQVLYQVSDALRGELDMQNLLWKVMHLIWRVMAPDRGIILVQDKDDGSSGLTPVVVKTDTPGENDIIISQAIVEKCLEDKAAILMADAPTDPRFSSSESIVREQIRSILCAPLVAQGQPFGVIYVDLTYASGQDVSRSFSMDDLEMMTGIANQAALALDNARLHMAALKHQRLERELEIARDIQDQLLPTKFPALEGIDFAALCIPARQVGGDYYDFFQIEEGCTAIIVGDASGKGVPAAISVAMLRTAVRARVRSHLREDLGLLMADLNHALCNDSFRDNFITVVVLLYFADGTIVYSNAGHVPPILVRADETIEKLEAGGPLLAALPDATYDSATLKLQPGDVLLIYSDGVTDTHSLNGELYGEHQLQQELRQRRGESAQKICDYITESVVNFRETREPFDDMTLVVLKAGPNDNNTQFA